MPSQRRRDRSSGIERFPAKRALGHDLGVETGSRQENASHHESEALFQFDRDGAPVHLLSLLLTLQAPGLGAPQAAAVGGSFEQRNRIGGKLPVR